MKNRGFTLVELMVGVVTATIIGTVSAQLLKVGLMTYNHTVRQHDSLSRTRRALGGEGAATGILWASRGANTVSGIDAAAAAVVAPVSAEVTSYYVAGPGLYRSRSGTAVMQADEITGLTVNYYNMSPAGVLQVSSAPSAATLVTTLVTMQGKTSRQTDYRLFSGAALRNHE